MLNSRFYFFIICFFSFAIQHVFTQEGSTKSGNVAIKAAESEIEELARKLANPTAPVFGLTNFFEYKSYKGIT